MQSAPGFPVPRLGANMCLCPVCKPQGPAGGGVGGRHGEGLAWRRGKPPWLRDGRASGSIAAFPPALGEREEVVLNVLLAAS